MYDKANYDKQQNGFTLVELTVVILIISVLAMVLTMGYSSWRKTIIEVQIKSDLSGVASAMENFRTFNSMYSSSIPATFTPSKDITLFGGSSDGKLYCIDAVSSHDSNTYYYIDESSGRSGAKLGTCATRSENELN